jgi:magnesium transporter
MDSPHSEHLETRFSTPVSELDDHRQQPLLQAPLAPLPEGRPRAPTIRSNLRPEEPNFTQSPEDIAPRSRDFEQAIIDDDKSGIDELSSTLGGFSGRKFSRRVRDKIERLSRSRESSPSDRSSSPPNSVDAFAEPRRRERTGTFGSQGASEFEAQLQRTVSGGTRGRRPTFDNLSARPVQDANAEPRAEDDVCFLVTEEPSKSFKIDYEEIEEFVALSKRGRPAEPIRQRHSFSSQDRIRPILSAKIQSNGVSLPGIIEHAASPTGRDYEISSKSEVRDDSPDANDEKLGTIKAERNNSYEGTNRFSFFSSEIEQTIHAPEMGDLIMPGETFRDLFELPPESGAWWLDVMCPTEQEMDMFQKAFGIHRLTAEDIERQEIREKVELFNKYYFVCFRSFYQMDKESEDYLEPVNVYMVVFREGILTFTYAASPHAAEVRKRIGKLRNYINLTADWICYAMVDNIVDSFGPVIRHLELETDQIEDSVFVARTDDFSSLLRRIGECRKKVMTLMRLLGGKADVIKGFAKRCNEQFGSAPRGEIGLYLGDIQDHVVTMMSNLGHFEKMLSRSHSNYLAQLSVDQIAQGNRANEVLGKITLIATVLVPLNLICGLFGMNVPVPGGVNDGPLYWFFGIIGVIAVVVVVSMIVARRLRYI